MKLITNNTYDELVRAAEAAQDRIPEAHNRKREQAYYGGLIVSLNKQDGAEIRPEELREGDILVYTRTNNYGTRKHPYYLRVVFTWPLTQTDLDEHRTRSGFVWRGPYKGSGTRIYDGEVLAVVR